MLCGKGMLRQRCAVAVQSYYGLQLLMGSLAGSIYLNTALSFLVELPAYAACALLIDRIGRRPLMMWSLLLGGLGCALAQPCCTRPCHAFSSPFVGRLC